MTESGSAKNLNVKLKLLKCKSVIWHFLSKSHPHQHAVNLGMVQAAKDLSVVFFIAWEMKNSFRIQHLKDAASELGHSLYCTWVIPGIW